MNDSPLISLLSELQDFLERHHVNYAVVIQNFLEKLKLADNNNETRVIINEARRELLGGMGSLNDIWICRVDI